MSFGKLFFYVRLKPHTKTTYVNAERESTRRRERSSRVLVVRCSVLFTVDDDDDD